MISKTEFIAIVALFLIQAPGILGAESPGAFPPVLTLTPAGQYRFAESLFQKRDDAGALVEFSRFLHFFPEDNLAPQAALYLAKSHARLGHTDAAVETLNSVVEKFPGTPSALSASFLISDVYRDSAQPAQALINLQNLLRVNPAPGIQDQIRYRMAWIHIDTGQWEAAGRLLGQVGPVGRADLPVGDLETDLNRAGSIPSKDPALAGALSIIPGGGQLYLGRHQDALVAFLLNGALIWAAVESFDKELYALGAVISVVELGFYGGNIYGAVAGAHKYNARQGTAFIEDLKLRFGVGNGLQGSHHRKVPAIGVALTYAF